MKTTNPWTLSWRKTKQSISPDSNTPPSAISCCPLLHSCCLGRRYFISLGYPWPNLSFILHHAHSAFHLHLSMVPALAKVSSVFQDTSQSSSNLILAAFASASVFLHFPLQVLFLFYQAPTCRSSMGLHIGPLFFSLQSLPRCSECSHDINTNSHGEECQLICSRIGSMSSDVYMLLIWKWKDFYPSKLEEQNKHRSLTFFE